MNEKQKSSIDFKLNGVKCYYTLKKKPNTFYKLAHEMFVFYPTVQKLHAGNITQLLDI